MVNIKLIWKNIIDKLTVLINLDQIDLSYYEEEKQYAKQYLQNIETNLKETTDAKLKWSCERYSYVYIIFLNVFE